MLREKERQEKKETVQPLVGRGTFERALRVFSTKSKVLRTVK